MLLVLEECIDEIAEYLHLKYIESKNANSRNPNSLFLSYTLKTLSFRSQASPSIE